MDSGQTSSGSPPPPLMNSAQLMQPGGGGGGLVFGFEAVVVLVVGLLVLELEVLEVVED